MKEYFVATHAITNVTVTGDRWLWAMNLPTVSLEKRYITYELGVHKHNFN